MKHVAIDYLMPDGRRLRFAKHVVVHFRRYRQSRPWHREAGGQLFATFDGDVVTVDDATGPRPTDMRSLNSYVPDRVVEQAEISARYPLGLHFLGDWHSHRERTPSPSGRDLASMDDMFCRSQHSLQGFVLVIVGTTRFPAGLHVSIHNSTGWTPLPILPPTNAPTSVRSLPIE